jgi:lipopolysaccharide/colanic/teichoic acid biosynthesis glycosyltransferase
MMITQSAPALIELPTRQRHPTLWGLDPLQLHDHFWAARGVFVVRLGEQREIPQDAELYLLTDARTLAIFRLAQVLDTLSWVRPGVMFLRLINRQNQEYRETVQLDSRGQFLRFRRLYGGVVPRLARVALTRDPRVAFVWQQSTDSRTAWKRLRREARSYRGEAATIRGRAYDRSQDREVAQFVNDLVRYWQQPSATIPDIAKLTPGVWGPSTAKIPSDVRFIGPAWIGAGRQIEAAETVLGPAVLWDDPDARPAPSTVRWAELEPSEVLAVVRRRSTSSRGPLGKRIFDILFASLVLIFTFPIYPLVMLAIWLEDGRPFFFAHRRETLGGTEFPCIKFRSMRKDAEKIKARLLAENQADGPQFYIAKDPRLTRVGQFIRKYNIDELPQFINVLLGHMSVVGPRPSPRSENQFSPAWREARLSVRAGVTGLWQVSRTRRPGLDFQEWIKFDLQYVQTVSWRLDLWIIFRTLRVLLRG